MRPVGASVMLSIEDVVRDVFVLVHASMLQPTDATTACTAGDILDRETVDIVENIDVLLDQGLRVDTQMFENRASSEKFLGGNFVLGDEEDDVDQCERSGEKLNDGSWWIPLP